MTNPVEQVRQRICDQEIDRVLETDGDTAIERQSEFDGAAIPRQSALPMLTGRFESRRSDVFLKLRLNPIMVRIETGECDQSRDPRIGHAGCVDSGLNEGLCERLEFGQPHLREFAFDHLATTDTLHHYRHIGRTAFYGSQQLQRCTLDALLLCSQNV